MPILILVFAASLAVALGGAPPAEPEFTSDFGLENCDTLVPNGDNPYFPLQPGFFRRYEGMEDGQPVVLEIKLLAQTRPVVFRIKGQWKVAFARVLREREWVDGELAEISFNYFARCPGSDDIFYCGEDVNIYENGVIVGHDGAWLAGVDDALPGMIMPGRPLLGSRYFQEIAPDVAMDQARHVRAGLEVSTPAGVFQNCIKVVETTPLDPDSVSNKIYAPGVGLIADGALLLVEYHD